MGRTIHSRFRLLQLVQRSAYPQLWRDILSQCLTTPGVAEPTLEVSVLRHRATGAVVMFGCLSEITTTAATAPVETPRSWNGATSEWSAPCAHARPDLAAIRAAGCVWSLEEIWQEVSRSFDGATAALSSTKPESGLLVNGMNNNNGNGRGGRKLTLTAIRWVLCVNLEASPTSPAYQIMRDGYPTEEAIVRLQAMRNVHLKGDGQEKTEPRVCNSSVPF